MIDGLAARLRAHDWRSHPLFWRTMFGGRSFCPLTIIVIGSEFGHCGSMRFGNAQRFGNRAIFT